MSSILYRSGTYRGKSSLDGDTNGGIIKVSTIYPYASQSDNVYSHGVCIIVDPRPIFTGSPVTMYPNHADYKGPRRISSNAIFPLYDRNTTMKLSIMSSPYVIVTNEEPLYRDSKHMDRYYTYGNNGATEYVDTLLSENAVANNYLLSLIDTTFVLPNTGKLSYYGIIAMLNLLTIYKTRARNYIYDNGYTTTLLDDYSVEKELFFSKGLLGMPSQSTPIWRALPENKLIETLLPETFVGSIEEMRDSIIEFVVKTMYSAYNTTWEGIATIRRSRAT